METEGSNIWFETPAGKQIQQKLSNQKILNSLDHLLSRIDTLDKAVEKLTVVMEQGPGMVSMAADMADEAYLNASKNGVDIQKRLENGLLIAEKLTAPEMIDKLNALLNFANQAPGLISITMDMADEQINKLSSNGVYLEERLGHALSIAEKLTAPEMVAKLDDLLKLADQAPGLISIAVDSFDEQMSKLNKSGLDIQNLIKIGQDANSAIAKAKEMPNEKVGGIFSMIKTMKDPDRQKALGFLMNIAKAYGQELAKNG